tara:strand:+ start:528 stop:752 length:225 start_codon:yes stop_codon:yes gene_type:complete
MAEVKPQIVVVYRKSASSKKRYMSVFNDRRVDDILMEKRNPLIPNEYVLDDIGVGSSFIIEYQNKYKINKYKTI